ncbi:unnamed protein product, partial [Rotaria sp. Silwood1]
MSSRGNQPHQNSSTNNDQEDTPTAKTDSFTANQQQSSRNTPKRIKQSDHSFELEHRKATIPNKYFNYGASRQ